MSDQKIQIDTRLTLQWHLVESTQKAEQIDFINAPAIQLLEVLESHQNTSVLKPIQNDLSRLESKVDLLIQLFIRDQYNKQVSNIPNYTVSISADSITIKTQETLKVEQIIELKIFFSQSCPEPLVFIGKVVTSNNPETLVIKFCNIGQLSQDFLEKYIFRLHRNEIALIKQN